MYNDSFCFRKGMHIIMKEKPLGVRRDIFKHMNNKNRKFIVIKLCIIFSILIFSMCFYCTNTFAESKLEKHVLIMIPSTQEYPGTSLYINGIKNALEKNSEFKFNYSYEYADLPRHKNDEGYLEAIGKYLKVKYSNYQPDFIITLVNLNHFFEEYGQDIFPNVPVIIDWDKEDIPINPIRSNHVIISQLSTVDQNIQLILKTKPLTKKIYIVIGSSIDKPNLSKPILDAEEDYSNKVEFVLLENLSYEDMLEAIKNAESNSVILYFQWLSDINGESFIPVEVIKTICQEAKVPVYGGSIQYLGCGVIGGYVGNQELMGETAGNVVLDILNGKKHQIIQ